MPMPLGELLVCAGAITPEQRDEIIAQQRARSRPFGQIAEELFGVGEDVVEACWADQYAQTTEWVEPASYSPACRVREMVSRRQAWQFRVIPLGFDGNQLMVCTTRANLLRAMRFGLRHFTVDCYFVLAESDLFGAALESFYTMDGMNGSSVDRSPGEFLEALGG